MIPPRSPHPEDSARPDRLVLLVQPRADRVALVRAHVAEAGFGVVRVQGCDDAVAALERFSPDVVLLADALPDASGVEAVRCLLDANPVVPVIVLVEERDEDVEVAIMLAGAKDCLLDRPELYPALPRILEQTLARVDVEKRHSARERLAALGRVGSTIVHEVGNPAFAARLHLRTARRILEAGPGVVDDRVLRALRYAEEGVCRIEGQLRELRRLGKLEHDDACVSISWDEVVPRALGTLAHQLEDVADVEVHIDADTPPVLASRRRLEQVVTHLVSNACEALRSTRRRGHIEIRASAADGGALLEIVDDGAGFSPEALQRATEPFWTSKAPHADIGFMICSDILAGYGGSLDVSNRVAGGALVRVWLPSAAP